MQPVSGFEHGSVVALREIWRGRVWKARPAIVVRDDEEQVALWTPDGAPMQIADTGSGIPAPDWRLVPHRVERGALRVHAPGSPLVHVALWLDREFDGWKVDVVRPLRRFDAGYEYLDLELDVSVPVKGDAAIVDEQEFREACRRGVIDEREAAAVLRVARAALASADARESPFADGWDAWLPNTAWPLPALPDGWDAPAGDLPRLDLPEDVD